MSKWKMIGRPEPRGKGQRFFIRDGERGRSLNPPRRVYLCDNSGEHPDETDDGPLLIRTGIPIRLGWFLGEKGNKIVGEVTVASEREGGKHYKAGLSINEVAWCINSLDMYVEAPAAIRDHLQVLALVSHGLASPREEAREEVARG